MRWRNRATFIAFRMLVDYFGNRLTRAIRTAQRDLVRQLGRDAVGEEFLLFFAYCLCQCVAGAQEDIKQDPLPKRRAWGLRRVRRLLETADWRQVAQRLLEHHAQGPWPPHRQERPGRNGMRESRRWAWANR